MGIPEVDKFDIVEVKFKGGRKDYYRNTNQLRLTTGDPVVVDVPNGHHIGYVSLQGELVRLQMQKRKIKDNDDILKVYRIGSQKDLEKWVDAKNREIPTLYRSKQIIEELGMQMKLSDVEYQADNSKATFYYSADDRVDFRELIKLLAGEFRIRIEMRQISLRQEAGRIGGVGVCGRELCCSTWIHDFKSVSTSAARYQNLSLNPSKLSGQCGRLKCCLNYELDTYLSALKDIPQVDKPLLTEAGSAKLQKTDIFRKIMWFSYNNDNNWHSIDCERVTEIIELNSEGTKPFNLKQNKAFEGEEDLSKTNRDLELLDKKFSSQVKKKRKKKPRNPASPDSKSKPEETASAKPENTDNRERSPKKRTGRKSTDPSRKGTKEQNESTVDPQNKAGNKSKEGRSNKRRNSPRNRGKGGQSKGGSDEGKD